MASGGSIMPLRNAHASNLILEDHVKKLASKGGKPLTLAK
jgi:hypothetical protein